MSAGDQRRIEVIRGLQKNDEVLRFVTALAESLYDLQAIANSLAEDSLMLSGLSGIVYNFHHEVVQLRTRQRAIEDVLEQYIVSIGGSPERA